MSWSKSKENSFSKIHRRNRTLEKLISASTIMAPTHDRVIGMDPDEVKTPISAPQSYPKTWEKTITTEGRPPLPTRASTGPKQNTEISTREAKEDEEHRPQLPTRASTDPKPNGEVSTKEVKEDVEHRPQLPTRAGTDSKHNDEISTREVKEDEEHRPQLPKRASTDPKHNGEVSTREVKEDEKHRPQLPTRASTDPKHNGEVSTREVKEDEEHRPQLPTRPSDIAGYGGAEMAKTMAQEAGERVRHDIHRAAEKLRMVGHRHDLKSPYFTITEAVHRHMRIAYDALCQGEKGLRTSDFVKFLREEQGQAVNLPEDRHKERDFKMSSEKRWKYEEWLAYLCYHGFLEGVRHVDTVGLVRPDGLKLKHNEMTAEERDALRYPITSYFIDSSHNTYLEGHQWTSASTANAYKYVLQKGCRCIEIDVHNGDMALKKAAGVKDLIKPTAVSELMAIGSKKLDKGKDKVDEIKSMGKQWFHKAKHSISGGKKSPPKSPRTEELSRELDQKDIGHRRNQSSTGTVPKISRYPTTDSEGGSIYSSEDDTAVDLTTDGKPGDKKSSRASSKSSDASSIHPERTGEPIVMHGWTPTTSWCFFRDVCKTVAEHAFETTNLPVIVSLEVACSWEQQELMVKIMKEEWKGMLVDEPLSDCDPTIRQPRLDELFNKILVKVKRHVATGEDMVANTEVEDESKLQDGKQKEKEQRAQPLMADGHPQSSTASSQTTLLSPNASTTATSSTAVSSASVTPTATPAGANLSPSTSVRNLERLDTTSTKSSVRSRDRSSSGPQQPGKSPKLPKICKNLSALGIYTHSEHFSKFTDKSSYSPSHIYSIDEHDILDLYEKQAAAMHEHNKKYFMRAYPEWKRIGSSNLDPSVYWRKGVQMAAVNAQTWDEGTMVNRGMFEGTGGWVLKPSSLRPRTKNPTWNPNAENREEAEAGIVEMAAGKISHSTPTTNTPRALPLTSTTSFNGPKIPVGLGLEGLEEPEHVSKPLPRAAALDPPMPSPSKKDRARSPRPSNASANPVLPMSPRTSSTSITSPKSPIPKSPKSPKPSQGGVLNGLVLSPQLNPVQNSELQARALNDSGKDQTKTLNFIFRIYAAQGLHGDKDMHVRVKIEMHAETEGGFKEGDWKKETKSRHTTNPDWNGEEVRFMGIGSKGDPDDHVRGHIAGPQEELSFVRFKLEDDNTLKKDEMLAWRAIRLDRLHTGYRFIRLYKADGEKDGGLLLIHVRREEI